MKLKEDSIWCCLMPTHCVTSTSSSRFFHYSYLYVTLAISSVVIAVFAVMFFLKNRKLIDQKSSTEISRVPVVGGGDVRKTTAKIAPLGKLKNIFSEVACQTSVYYKKCVTGRRTDGGDLQLEQTPRIAEKVVTVKRSGDIPVNVQAALHADADTGTTSDTTVQTTGATVTGRDSPLKVIDRAVDEFRKTCEPAPVTSTGTSPPWPSLLPPSTPRKRDTNQVVHKSHSSSEIYLTSPGI